MSNEEKKINKNEEKEAKENIVPTIKDNVENQNSEDKSEINESKIVDSKEPNTAPKNKRLLAFSLVGGIAVVIVVIAIVLLICAIGKPSKSKSKEIIEDYLKAVNEDDSDLYAKLIDAKGYIIFNEEGEKKFDKKYKSKNYISNYLEDKSYDDLSDAKDAIVQKFKSKYMYLSKEYSFKELTEVKKSNKSKKIYIIKAKLKVKSSYSSSSDTTNLKLYVIKVDGKYKVINAEID